MIKNSKKIKSYFNLALKKYPELSKIKINISFKKSKILMKALPKYNFIFKKKDKREYNIIVSKDYEKFINELTKKELIAWFSHELTHIKQYVRMNSLKLIGFGIKYLLIKKFTKKVERSVDKEVFKKGMKRELLSGTKKSLNSKSITIKYKKRIREYYLHN